MFKVWVTIKPMTNYEQTTPPEMGSFPQWNDDGQAVHRHMTCHLLKTKPSWLLPTANDSSDHLAELEPRQTPTRPHLDLYSLVSQVAFPCQDLYLYIKLMSAAG